MHKNKKDKQFRAAVVDISFFSLLVFKFDNINYSKEKKSQNDHFQAYLIKNKTKIKTL